MTNQMLQGYGNNHYKFDITKAEQKERLVKLGMSKSVPKDHHQDAPLPIKKRVEVPKLGDIKKDKMKNSLAMTNEEKEKLQRREREMSRNRGVCMVSSTGLVARF